MEAHETDHALPFPPGVKLRVPAQYEMDRWRQLHPLIPGLSWRQMVLCSLHSPMRTGNSLHKQLLDPIMDKGVTASIHRINECSREHSLGVKLGISKETGTWYPLNAQGNDCKRLANNVEVANDYLALIWECYEQLKVDKEKVQDLQLVAELVQLWSKLILIGRCATVAIAFAVCVCVCAYDGGVAM